MCGAWRRTNVRAQLERYDTAFNRLKAIVRDRDIEISELKIASAELQHAVKQERDRARCARAAARRRKPPPSGASRRRLGSRPASCPRAAALLLARRLACSLGPPDRPLAPLALGPRFWLPLALAPCLTIPLPGWPLA